MTLSIPKDTPGRKGRILVVDDEPVVRRAIRLPLQKEGYDVVEAENGEEAIKVLQSGDNPMRVSVITCDIRMPQIGGVEAIEYFRNAFPSIPVVVITAYPETEMAVTLMKQGVTDYVTKPVEGPKLLQVVAEAMEKHGDPFRNERTRTAP